MQQTDEDNRAEEEEEEEEEEAEEEVAEEEQVEEEFAMRMAVKEVQMVKVGCLNIANCMRTFSQNIFNGTLLLFLLLFLLLLVLLLR